MTTESNLYVFKFEGKLQVCVSMGSTRLLTLTAVAAAAGGLSWLVPV